MSSHHVTLAQAIVAALNAADPGTFSIDFTAVFKYAFAAKPQDADTPLVVVTLGSATRETDTRGSDLHSDEVWVTMLNRVPGAGGDPLDENKIEDSLAFLDEVHDFLRKGSIGNYDFLGSIRRVTDAPFYDAELKERLFAASLILQYQESRAVAIE